jgi:hypothetical protein
LEPVIAGPVAATEDAAREGVQDAMDLALDNVAGLELQLELSKLRSPLGDVARGVRVVENGL